MVNSTRYINGTNPADAIIVKVTDSQSDRVFNAGDTVSVTFNDGGVFSAEYLGTVSVTKSGEAQDFMVLKIEFSGAFWYYVVGLLPADAPQSIVETGVSTNITKGNYSGQFLPNLAGSTMNSISYTFPNISIAYVSIRK